MDFRKILEEYKYTSELHSHTNPVSSCGKFTADLSVSFYTKLGCNTLVITNHLEMTKVIDYPNTADLAEFYCSDYLAAKKAAEGTDLQVVFGVEARFANTTSDYLIYGISPDDVEEIASYIPGTVQDFYKGFKNDRNVIIHAHPFRPSMEPTPLGYVDGVETFNMHPGANSRIGIATKYAKENGLLVTGGSDFHDPGRMALCLMRTKALMRDSYDVAEAIKSKDVVFDLSGHIVIPYLY